MSLTLVCLEEDMKQKEKKTQKKHQQQKTKTTTKNVNVNSAHVLISYLPDKLTVYVRTSRS
jgi:hypothetical protein